MILRDRGGGVSIKIKMGNLNTGLLVWHPLEKKKRERKKWKKRRHFIFVIGLQNRLNRIANRTWL